jgi:hypothetical protein
VVLARCAVQTEASQNLFELVKGRTLIVYADADIRLAISRAVAIETSRGWRIAKEKQSHKIDVVIALAQAALGAVQQGQQRVEFGYIGAPKSDGLFASRLGRGRDGELTGQEVCDREDLADAVTNSTLRRSNFSRRRAFP